MALDKNNLSPEAISDHLASLLAKPLPKKPPKRNRIKPGSKSLRRRAIFRDVPEPAEVEVRLLGAHNINGFPYGPGTVSVSPALGRQLREMDGRAKRYDDGWQREKAVVVGPHGKRGEGHRTINVSPALFQSTELNVPEAGFADSNGGFSNG